MQKDNVISLSVFFPFSSIKGISDSFHKEVGKKIPLSDYKLLKEAQFSHLSLQSMAGPKTSWPLPTMKLSDLLISKVTSC